MLSEPNTWTVLGQRVAPSLSGFSGREHTGPFVYLRWHCLLDHGLSPTPVGTLLGRSQPGLCPRAMPPTVPFCTCFILASLSCLLVSMFGLLIPSDAPCSGHAQ